MQNHSLIVNFRNETMIKGFAACGRLERSVTNAY